MNCEIANEKKVYEAASKIIDEITFISSYNILIDEKVSLFNEIPYIFSGFFTKC